MAAPSNIFRATQAPGLLQNSPGLLAWLQSSTMIGETLRFKQLDRYEAHYVGQQYAHLKQDWWGLDADAMETVSATVQVPLGFSQPGLSAKVRGKRPTAPYNLCTSIVDRFTGLLFSEQRKPEVVVENDPDTEDWLSASCEQARVWAKAREARTIGGSVGGVMTTLHLREGQWSIENHNIKHVVAVRWRDWHSFRPEAALIQYSYPVEEPVLDDKSGLPSGGMRTVDYLYRRLITEREDIVFRPVKMSPGVDIGFEVDSINNHNLGFFPGVWCQNLPTVGDMDGKPDCDGAWQNFDTVDRMISQMNKGLLNNLDPTVRLKLSEQRREEMGGGGISKGSDNAIDVGLDGDAAYMEMQGSAVTVAKSFVDMLVQNSLQVTRCVLVDPATISGAAQSAKAIEYMFAPMIEKADDLRAQYGDLWVIPILRMMVRMARAIASAPVMLSDGRAARQEILLPPRIEEQPLPEGAPPDAEPQRKVIERQLGPGGHIRIKWGPYFAPTETDLQTAIANVIAVKTGGLLDQETAVKLVAALFRIKDPAAVLRKIKQEEEDQMSRSLGGMGGGLGIDDPLGYGDPNAPAPGGPPRPGQPPVPGKLGGPPGLLGGRPPARLPNPRDRPAPPAGAGGKS